MRSQSSQIHDCCNDLELQQNAHTKISETLCSVANIKLLVKALKQGWITKTLKSYYEVLGDKNIIFLGPGDIALKWCSIIFHVLCLLALSVDPLFCYILVVNVDNKCLTLDKTLGTITIVLRCCVDFFYTIHVIVRFRNSIDTLSNEASRKDLSDTEHRAIARRRLLLYLYFTVDVLVVLPFPQVAVFAVIPKINESRVFKATKPLNFIVIIQYMMRIVRICSLLKNVTRVFRILTESVSANLCLIMLTSHVFGAFWYLFSIERKVECWREDCSNRGVRYCSLFCDDTFSRGSSTLFPKDDSCSTKAGNSTLFYFGIYTDAIESGVVGSADFIHKISYCFWWGLQNLSSFGQGFKTSSNLSEVYFAVLVSVSGMVLFAFLIGNIQAYLQTKSARLENLEKGKEMELWLGFRSLPPSVKHQFRQYQKYDWQENKCIDVDKYLNKLPRDLARDIRKHHFSLKKVPILKDMVERERERVLDAMYDHLKPVLYLKDSIIFQVGDPLDEMLFVTRGQLCIYTLNQNEPGSRVLEKGNFYGEELLHWASNSPTLSSLPSSKKTVKAETKQVQIFALRANQLRNVVTKFRWLFVKELRLSSGSEFDSDPWKQWAATVLQAAFRRLLHNIKLQQKKSSRGW